MPPRASVPRCRRAYVASPAWAVLAGLLLGGAPASAAPVALGDVSLEADRITYTEAGDRLEAAGRVRVERGGVRIEADRLLYDARNGTGSVEGALRVTGGLFELQAARGVFDLKAGWADLLDFRGHWAQRGQVRGRRLRLSETLIELEDASAAPCRHVEPDLLLVARRFSFDPRTTPANLLMEGLSLRASSVDLLSVPAWRSRLDDRERPGFDGWVFPSLGFDLYQGFLSGTRVPFHLGPASLGTLDLLATTGRGLAAGLQHAFSLPLGELSNGVRYEAPWATGNGGLRVTNHYTWRREDGASLELAADYRANLNETAVHRLPEALAVVPPIRLGTWGVLRPEARAGFLWEDLSGAQAVRARAGVTAEWLGWEPVPGWRTWAVASPWGAYYLASGHFLGAQAAWHARQQLGADTVCTQMVETVRLTGATPLIHDRLLPVDRLRFGVERRWHPRLSSRLEGAWSRLFHEGPWLPEDLALVGTYSWNCFALDVTLRPLVGGCDARFRLLQD